VRVRVRLHRDRVHARAGAHRHRARGPLPHVRRASMRVRGLVLMLRRAFQILFGSIAGALMGLCVFVLGYIMASWPATALNRHAVALLASRALASLSFAEFACITLGACAGLLLARCSWRSYGVASYVAVVSVVAGYV